MLDDLSKWVDFLFSDVVLLLTLDGDKLLVLLGLAIFVLLGLVIYKDVVK